MTLVKIYACIGNYLLRQMLVLGITVTSINGITGFWADYNSFFRTLFTQHIVKQLLGYIL